MIENVSLWLLIAIIFYLLYKWSTSTFDYWEKLGVVYDKESIYPLVGNLKPCFFNKKHFGDVVDDFYRKFNAKADFGGFFVTRKPTLIPLNAEMSYSLCVKDFTHFYDRGFHIDENFDVLANNLFFNSGATWKYQRTKISPALTSGKLRNMVGTIDNTVNIFIEHMKKYSGQEIVTEDKIRECIISFLGTVVCGLEYYNIDNPDPEFHYVCTELNKPSLRTFIKTFLDSASPWLTKKVKQFPNFVSDYFTKLANQSMELKKENSDQKSSDFLQLLIDLHREDEVNKGKEGYFDMKSVIGNFFIFLAAGEETSTANVTMMLYYLSQYPEVRKRLVEEIDSILATVKGELAYDVVMKDFPYLNAVIEETMRFFPMAYVHLRVCTKDYTIPSTGITIKKGVKVLIPVASLHYDPRYWVDPEKFNPERFMPANRDRIVPGSYLPFGIGPRMCIGSRLAMLDMKIILIRLLQHFEISTTPRTPKKIEYDYKNNVTLYPTDKIYLKYTLRTDI